VESPERAPLRAGDRDRGDRIVSVDGAKVGSWDELRAAIKDHGRDDVALGIGRDGTESTLLVPLPRSGPAKLNVGPFTERTSIGAGEALGDAFALPFQVVYRTGEGVVRMVRGEESREMSGASAVVRETASAAHEGIGAGLLLVAALISYSLWIAVILAFVVTPRRTDLGNRG
jgi:hypothetical protein